MAPLTLFPIIPPVIDNSERLERWLAQMQKTLTEKDAIKTDRAKEMVDKATDAFMKSTLMQVEWFLEPHAHLAPTHNLCYHPGNWRQDGNDNVFEQWVSLQPKARFTGPPLAEMPDWDGPKCLLHFTFTCAFSSRGEPSKDAETDASSR